MIYVNHSLNSVKGDSTGDYVGEYYRAISGDSRSLDYGSCHHILEEKACLWPQTNSTLDTCPTN